MTEPTSCPACGAEFLVTASPQGLCPRCLIEAGLEEQSTAPENRSETATGLSASISPGPIAAEPCVLPHPKSAALQPGETLGPYRIERLLGMGGMGEVYAAEDQQSGRRMALKILGRKLREPEDRARFLREGRLAASLNHPNSIYVFGTSEINGIPVIVMELAAGGTLKDRVQDKGPMRPTEAVEAILQLIDGLEAAAAAGILHRDVKPSNCFLDTDGTVKIGDFGLSIPTLSRMKSDVTTAGTFLGTPSFASPEQIRSEDLDVRSDVYSVGATLYFLLTGRALFEEPQLGSLVAAVLERPPDRPRLWRPEIPVGLERVILRCLKKEASSRYGSYAALKRDLTPFRSTAPTPATLALRLPAWLLDSWIIYVPVALILFAVERRTGTFLARSASAAALLLYFSITEGFWGASIGKTVFQLRVIGPDGGPPGWRRALARAFIVIGAGQIGELAQSALFAYWSSSNAGPAFGPTFADVLSTILVTLLVTLALALLPYGILFSTARRRNGFAGLHELATGTRSIRRSALFARPVSGPSSQPVSVPNSAEQVGPYSILSTLREEASARLLLGYDTLLKRRVWIQILPAGTPSVPPIRRDLSRPARLRWLNGQRNDRLCWDAYDAPDGKALADLAGRKQPWSAVRYWLLDLAEELDTGGEDHSLPTTLTTANLWITADGRAKILDFPAPRIGGLPHTSASVGAQSTNFPSIQRLLRRVGGYALDEGATSLPLYAKSLLADLGSFQFPDAAELTGRLRSLTEKPVRVSRAKRAVHLAFCSAYPLVMIVSLVAHQIVFQRWDALHPDLAELNRCLALLEGMESSTSLDRTRLEIYIASRYRSRITDLSLRVDPSAAARISQSRLRLAQQALARHSHLTHDEVAQAEATIRPVIERIPRPDYNVIGGGSRLLGIQLVVTAIIGILSAFFFQGGFLFRQLGIVVVGPASDQASVSLTFWRGVIAWSPALCSILPYQPAGLWISSALFFIGAAAALATPERGLQDRITGTRLAPL